VKTNSGMNLTRSQRAWEEKFTGALLGTAVGDALGLPAENLSPERIRKWWGGDWRMRFLFGKGMVSDDTEHTLMVAQTLLSCSGDAAEFQRALAWKFRWWLAALPGGVGLATARACLKLWMGFPSRNAGVASGGSGPAMRSAIIGAYFADDSERRRAFVSASSCLTHRGWQGGDCCTGRSRVLGFCDAAARSGATGGCDGIAAQSFR
jgi:ADP-ribosyl-[dinitrogen reductase] hydrolase